MGHPRFRQCGKTCGKACGKPTVLEKGTLDNIHINIFILFFISIIITIGKNQILSMKNEIFSCCTKTCNFGKGAALSPAAPSALPSVRPRSCPVPHRIFIRRDPCSLHFLGRNESALRQDPLAQMLGRADARWGSRPGRTGPERLAIADQPRSSISFAFSSPSILPSVPPDLHPAGALSIALPRAK